MAVTRIRSIGLQWLSVVTLAICSMLLAACGSGGGSATSPPAGDFSISASPTTLSLENGQSQTVTVGVTAVNTFTSVVSITVSGLPTGVTATPTTFSVAPGGQQKVTLTTAATVAAGSAAVTFQGTSGTLSHSAQVSLTTSYVSPDFSLAVTPATLSVETGARQNVTVSAAGSNGFSSSVSVSTSGIPSGVTATPSTFTIGPGGQQNVALTVGPTATAGLYSLSFAGTSGSLIHSSQTALTVVAAVTGMHAPMRTRALRTDATLYDSIDWQWSPPKFSAYDLKHRRFFVSNSSINKIDVFDAGTEAETATISVPGGPWGLDISPFDGNLYVGAESGDIYVIDTGALAVTKRYRASEIGHSGFMANSPMVLAGGLIALSNQSYAATGGAEGTVVVWDPIANSLDYGPSGPSGESVCSPYGGTFALSGDRTRILVATSNWSSFTGNHICSYDPVAKRASVVQQGKGSSDQAAVRAIVPTPDGGRFFAIEGSQIETYDAKTLNLLAQNFGPFTWNGGNPERWGGTPEFTSGLMSTDGKTLYVYEQLTGEIGAFDPATLAQSGWISSTFDDSNVTGAIDETGLIIGPVSGGVAYIDAARLLSSPPTYMTPFYPTPNSGPMSGDSALSYFASIDTYVTDGATLAQAYLGNTLAQNPSIYGGGTGVASTVLATTPPSSLEGVVDTTVTLSDGAVATCMECFSYGPSIIEVVSNAATTNAGGTGLLVGYGLGGTANYAGPTSGVSVTIGGQPANVIAVQAGAAKEPYPFNSDELIFAIPPGATSTAADVTVTTSDGSTTSAGAFHYIPASRTFPLSDTLQQGIYDARRDLYFFAGKSQIQVLSQTSGKWLSPINLAGANSSTQLMGIAESPDGSMLAVSDPGGQAIFVLNPDNPASAARFSMTPSATGNNFAQSPNGLVVTNGGIVYFATDPQYFELMKLDTASGRVTSIGNGWNEGKTCKWCRVVQSSDGRRIFGVNRTVGAFWMDPSTDQVTNSFSFGGGIGNGPIELAVSADGSTVDVNSEFADSSMNMESRLASTDWEWFYPAGPNSTTPPWTTAPLFGEELNADGSILFMPLSNAIDLYARNTGRLLYRVQIPVTPASIYGPLVMGKGTNVLAVISANWVTIVDMSSLPIATELTQPFAEPTNKSTRDLSNNSTDVPEGRIRPRLLAKLGGITKFK